jgi:hypothetical protein
MHVGLIFRMGCRWKPTPPNPYTPNPQTPKPYDYAPPHKHLGLIFGIKGAGEQREAA